MKNKMSYIKLLLLMIMGAAIGMGGNIIFSLSEGGMKNLAAESGKILHQTGLIIESVMALAVFAAVLAIYIYVCRLWKLEENSEDETADICGEKFEHWAEIGITITNIASGVLLIFGTISFPGEFMNIEKEDAIRFLILSAVMILGVVSMAVMQILLYHLMQKRDPQKKGDPSSFTFNKKWLEGCDETEMHLDDWTIARLLGHSSLKNVKYYRKMSNQILADETRKVRNMLSEMILENLDGWGEEYEQIRYNDSSK